MAELFFIGMLVAALVVCIGQLVLTASRLRRAKKREGL